MTSANSSSESAAVRFQRGRGHFVRGRARLLVIAVLIVVGGLLWVLAGLDARRQAVRTGVDTERGAQAPFAVTQREESETDAQAAGLVAAPDGGAGRVAAGTPESAGAGRGPGLRGRTSAARSGADGRAGPEPAPDMVWNLRVRSADAPGGVPGVDLELSGGPHFQRATTDAEGKARIAWWSGVASGLTLDHAEYLELRDPEVDLGQPGDYQLMRSATLVVELTGVTPTGPATVHLWRVRDSRAWSWPELAATAEEGRASFLDLEPGEYALSAEAPGATAPYEQGVALAEGEVHVRTLALQPPALVLGRVVELGTGAPVAGALLSIEPQKGAVPPQLRRMRRLEGESDAAGEFALEGLAPGSHRLLVDLPWWGRESREFDVGASGERVELTLEVAGPAPLAGLVLDAEGNAAPGARVVAVPRHERGRIASLVAGADVGRDPEGDHWLTADAAGSFLFEALPAREALTLLAFARGGGAPARASVPPRSPSSSGPRDVVLRLPGDLSAKGRVRDLEGKHLAGAEVVFVAPVDGKPVRWQRTLSGEDGRYSLEGLHPGAGTLEVTLSGYLRSRTSVELGDDEQLVDIELTPAMRVAGVARDRDGLAVAGVRVRIRPDPDTLADFAETRGLRGRDLRKLKYVAWTDRDGDFSIDNLEPLDWVPELVANDWELVRAAPRVLGPADRETWTLTLAPGGREARATLRAFVVRADDGAAVTGLRVGGLKGAAFELDGGELRATGVAPGPTRLTLEAKGFAPLRLPPFQLLPGEDRDLGRIELEPGTRLTVRVRDLAGKPLKGAIVRLRSLPKAAGGLGEGIWLPKPVAESGGRYAWDAVPRAAYTLYVRRPGFRILREPLTVRDKPDQKRSVVLAPAGG